jgi:hypothetical protein
MKIRSKRSPQPATEPPPPGRTELARPEQLQVILSGLDELIARIADYEEVAGALDHCFTLATWHHLNQATFVAIDIEKVLLEIGFADIVGPIGGPFHSNQYAALHMLASILWNLRLRRHADTPEKRAQVCADFGARGSGGWGFVPGEEKSPVLSDAVHPLTVVRRRLREAMGCPPAEPNNEPAQSNLPQTPPGEPCSKRPLWDRAKKTLTVGNQQYKYVKTAKAQFAMLNLLEEKDWPLGGVRVPAACLFSIKDAIESLNSHTLPIGLSFQARDKQHIVDWTLSS